MLISQSKRNLLRKFWMKLNEKKLRIWAKAVKAKALFKCKRCGAKKYLEAHHIYPKIYHPSKAYKLSNGVCLCRNCHREADDSLHSMVALRDCNPRTFKAWLRKTKSRHNKSTKFAKAIIFLVIGVLILISLLRS